MIAVLCGEDVTSSRSEFVKKINEFRKKNFRIESVLAKDVVETVKNEQSSSLFNDQIVYTTQNLTATLRKKKIKPDSWYKEISNNISVYLLNWEDGKSLYDLRLKKAPYIYEYKLKGTIFQFLDLIMPGKKQQALDSLNILTQTYDDFFIYTLLHKHIRKLITLKSSHHNSKQFPPWQYNKMLMQAQSWEDKKLLGLYEQLIKIEIAQKTSNTPYTISESLQVVICYYL